MLTWIPTIDVQYFESFLRDFTIFNLGGFKIEHLSRLTKNKEIGERIQPPIKIV
jgi:hypothetical protein